MMLTQSESQFSVWTVRPSGLTVIPQGRRPIHALITSVTALFAVLIT